MFRKILFCCMVLAAIICYSNSLVYAQWQIQFDSDANKTLHLGGDTLRGNFATEQACRDYWASRPAYERNHSTCVLTGSQSTGGYGSSNNFGQDMAVNLFGEMLKSVFTPPAQAPVESAAQAAAKAKAIEVEKLKKQKELQDYQAKQKAEQQAQEAYKKKQGEELFKQMSTFGSGNSLESEFFGSEELKTGSDDLLQMQSLSTGKYDTSSLSALDRLRVANYFSQKALAMRSEDDEGARHFSLQAQKVMAGEMVDEEYNLSALPNVPEPPAPTRVEEQSPEFANYNAYLKNDIKIKLERVDKTQKQIKEQKKKAEQDIVKFKNESGKAKSLEEKQKYDELVRKAKLILEEAKNSTKEIDKIKQGIIQQQKKLND